MSTTGNTTIPAWLDVSKFVTDDELAAFKLLAQRVQVAHEQIRPLLNDYNALARRVEDRTEDTPDEVFEIVSRSTTWDEASEALRQLSDEIAKTI